MKTKLKKAQAGIGLGLTLEILSGGLRYAMGGAVFVALAIWLIGTLLFIWGCTNYAEAKNLPNWIGYLGFFNLIGLAIIYLLPSRKSAHEQ